MGNITVFGESVRLTPEDFAKADARLAKPEDLCTVRAVGVEVPQFITSAGLYAPDVTSDSGCFAPRTVGYNSPQADPGYSGYHAEQYANSPPAHSGMVHLPGTAYVPGEDSDLHSGMFEMYRKYGETEAGRKDTVDGFNKLLAIVREKEAAAKPQPTLKQVLCVKG